MDNIVALLVDTDRALEEISVKGEDVFRMRNARVMMKQVFDLLTNLETEEQNQEESDNGG